jgi:2'-5' RNA ligase
MRLFFAAFPNEELRGRLVRAAAALTVAPGAKLLPAERYHLTLLFLGSVGEREIARLREVGKAQRIERSRLQFERWEYWRDQRVIVAAAPEVPPALAALRAALAAALSQDERAFDDKPLRPHITVARKVAQAPVLHRLSEFSWTLDAYSLVASSSEVTGSAYTVVDTWQLLDKVGDRRGI